MKTSQFFLNVCRSGSAIIAAGTATLCAEPGVKPQNGGEPGAIPQEASSAQSYQRHVSAVRPVGQAKVNGTILFDRASGGARMTVHIVGLEANKKYAVMVHEYGDLSTEGDENLGALFQPPSTAKSVASHGNKNSSSHSKSKPEPPISDKDQTDDKNSRLSSHSAVPGKSSASSGSNSSSIPGTSEATGTAGSEFELGITSGTANSDGVLRLQTTVPHFELGAGENGVLGRAVVIQEITPSSQRVNGDRVAMGVIGLSRPASSGREAGYNPKDTSGDSAGGNPTTDSSASPAPETGTKGGAEGD